MKKLWISLAAISSILMCGHVNAAGNQPVTESSALDLYGGWQLAYMRDQEKLARDINVLFHDSWGEAVFVDIAEAEVHYLDQLSGLLRLFSLQGMIGSDEAGVYEDERHAEAYSELVGRGNTSALEAYRAAAYVEEWNVDELNGSIAMEANQPPVVTILYSDMLASAQRHLRTLAAQMLELGYHYRAQILPQSDVDEILAGSNFVINAGLNDAWVNLDTLGQGFVFIVYPHIDKMFVAMFGYDTEPSAQGVLATLGGPNQRWLTGLGDIEGDTVIAPIELTTGGIFDSSLPVPERTADYGTFTVVFADCNHATVTYDFPVLDLHGEIEVTRSSLDNIGLCGALNVTPMLNVMP